MADLPCVPSISAAIRARGIAGVRASATATRRTRLMECHARSGNPSTGVQRTDQSARIPAMVLLNPPLEGDAFCRKRLSEDLIRPSFPRRKTSRRYNASNGGSGPIATGSQLTEPHWATVRASPAYRTTRYRLLSRAGGANDRPESLDEIDPGLFCVPTKSWVVPLRERENSPWLVVAVDAVFDSVLGGPTTFPPKICGPALCFLFRSRMPVPASAGS